MTRGHQTKQIVVLTLLISHVLADEDISEFPISVLVAI
jgi:hypothetical protein